MKSSAIWQDESPYAREELGEPVMSDPVEIRMARMESDIQHIKTDTADLRVELRRTNDKIDVTNKRIDAARDELIKKMDDGHKELSKKIEDGHKDLSKKIEEGHKELNKKIEDGDNELAGRIDGLKDKLHSLTIWALLLYFTLAGGLLTVIARAFKWI
jgi:chromosome segregation ATPase